MGATYHANKTVPLEIEELRLLEDLTIPGSPEHKALERIKGKIPAQLTEKEALSILVHLGIDMVQKELEDGK